MTTFKNYLEQIFALSEIIEVPGIKEQHNNLIKEMWHKFPVECAALGLTNGLK